MLGDASAATLPFQQTKAHNGQLVGPPHIVIGTPNAKSSCEEKQASGFTPKEFLYLLPIAAVLSESVLDQNGTTWSTRPFWSKWPDSEPDFSIRETKMVHFGLMRSILVHLGPPTVLLPFMNQCWHYVRVAGILTAKPR